MSEREKIQNTLVEFLSANTETFSAPYGVLSGLEAIGTGKVREITFGVSRYLDAIIRIWGANKITVRAQGALAYKLESNYPNVGMLLNDLKGFVS